MNSIKNKTTVDVIDILSITTHINLKRSDEYLKLMYFMMGFESMQYGSIIDHANVESCGKYLLNRYPYLLDISDHILKVLNSNLEIPDNYIQEKYPELFKIDFEFEFGCIFDFNKKLLIFNRERKEKINRITFKLAMDRLKDKIKNEQ